MNRIDSYHIRGIYLATSYHFKSIATGEKTAFYGNHS